MTTSTRRATSTDTGQFRNSIFAGLVSFGTTYAVLAAPAPIAVCVGIGGTATLAIFIWRIWEGDRRAYEVRTSTADAPEPEPIADERDVRPFVASVNGGGVANGQTVKVAGIAQPMSYWQRFIEQASKSDWTISRDGMRQAGGMKREYYADWNGTLGELERAGMVTRAGNQTKLTAEGIRAIASVAPLPRVSLGPRAATRAGGRNGRKAGESL